MNTATGSPSGPSANAKASSFRRSQPARRDSSDSRRASSLSAARPARPTRPRRQAALVESARKASRDGQRAGSAAAPSGRT